MRFSLSREQSKLRDGVRRLLDAECTPDTIRAAWDDGGGGAMPAPVARLWSELSAMGVLAAALPESADGLGLGACDLVPLLVESGRAGVPLPLMETAFVAAPLLAAATSAKPLVARLADGELMVACALDGSALIPHGRRAELLFLSTDASAGAPIRALHDPELEPLTSIDHSRGLARIGDPRAGQVLDLSDSQIRDAWLRGVLGNAAELVGLSRRLIEMTSAYVSERRQFGVPIGSFQAIKHHLADALIAVEFAQPAVMRAAWSIDHETPSKRRDVAMAKALTGDAAERVAGVALQCHGAIAYTTDYDLHLYAKRIWSSVRTWGSTESQRAIVAESIGL